MIVLAEELHSLKQACERFPASGTQIYGCFARYGNGYPFGTTWLCRDEDGAVWGALGRYNGSLRLSCGALTEERAQELREFFGMTGCVTLETSQAAVRMLFPQSEHRSGEVLEYRGAPPEIGFGEIEKMPRLDDVFHILKESDPMFARTAQYEEWLCDAAHLRNHDGGCFFTVGREAAAAVTALSPAYGLIGSVATVPAARGKGYASMLTQYAAAYLLDRGRTPILLAADERAAGLYRRLGFETTDRWAVIDI